MCKRLWASLTCVFGNERFTPYPLSTFGDHTVSRVYAEVTTAFLTAETDRTKPSKAEQLLTEAKNARGTKDRDTQLRAACIYLRHAQLLEDTPDDAYPRKPTAAEAYHYAANELRQQDLLDRAAQSYFNSALNALQTSRDAAGSQRDAALAPLSLALRSAGRAKALYLSLGDAERSDQAHQLRQEVSRRSLMLRRNPLWLLLYLWKVATGYGASAARWFTALLLNLLLFAGLYATGLSLCWFQLAGDAPRFAGITPLYLSVLNLLQFGAYTQLIPLHWGAQLILVLHGVVAFVLIGTGATFFTQK